MRSVLAVFFATLLLLLGLALASPIPAAARQLQLDARDGLSTASLTLDCTNHVECYPNFLSRLIRRATGKDMFQETQMDRTSEDENLRWSIF